VVGIASDFTDLDDVPGSYTSHANEILQVNASEDALAFTGVASLAGDIDHGNLAGLSTGADHSYIDQDVTSGSSPTFDGTNFTGIPNGAMDETYINADGTVSLSANWDIGDGHRIETDEIRARDGAGLKLYDDGGKGIFVEDGGKVGIGTAEPSAKLHSTISSATNYAGYFYNGNGDGLGLDIFAGYGNGGGTIIRGRTTLGDRFWVKESGTAYFNGNVGIGNTDPDTILHAADETATTDAILDIARIEAQCSGTVTDGFGVGLEFELETDGGQDVAGILAATWEDATHTTRQSQLELWTNYQGDEVLSGVIVAPSNASADGNARGVGAVDLQGYRSNASEVASGNYSVVAGGYENTAGASYTAVGGGSGNTTSSAYAVVAGGSGNTASGLSATVGGGVGNTASSGGAVVPGGDSNIADGNYSFAAGRQADTNSHNGVFIWADSENAAFTADRADQFKARCSGGAHFVQNDTSAAIPLLTLEQEDIDEPFLKFIGNASAENVTKTLVVEEMNVHTTERIGWFKIEVQDDGNQITDGDYYVPFYTLN
jgi:hypothetical protein